MKNEINLSIVYKVRDLLRRALFLTVCAFVIIIVIPFVLGEIAIALGARGGILFLLMVFYFLFATVCVWQGIDLILDIDEDWKRKRREEKFNRHDSRGPTVTMSEKEYREHAAAQSRGPREKSSKDGAVKSYLEN